MAFGLLECPPDTFRLERPEDHSQPARAAQCPISLPYVLTWLSHGQINLATVMFPLRADGYATLPNGVGGEREIAPRFTGASPRAL